MLNERIKKKKAMLGKLNKKQIKQAKKNEIEIIKINEGKNKLRKRKRELLDAVKIKLETEKKKIRKQKN